MSSKKQEGKTEYLQKKVSANQKAIQTTPNRQLG